MKKSLLILLLIMSAFTSPVLAMDKFIIKNAWLRVAPNQVAGGFFDIINQTDKTHHVVSATAVGAEVIELHSHTMTDGIMKMRKIEKVEMPANETLEFNPHGYHLMMFKLDKQVFAVGNMVEIAFTFEDNSTMTAKFQVLKFGTELKKDMDHSQMDHSKMAKDKK